MWSKKNHDFITRLKNGDKRAFEELFKGYKNMIYTIVNRMVFNKERVNDLTADIFLKIYQNIQHFDERSKFSTWMYRITYNHCLDYIRAAKRDPLESYEPIDTMYNLSSKKMGVDTMVLKKEREGVLHKIVDTMPEKYRMVLNFYYFEDISYNEISEIMGIPIGTVKTYLFRAKEDLREKMKKLGVL
ncbi:sigma-70 family RNA polymerase sigma factor [candidate division WOR-3 bacterium]|nr:sigma-70 family RNA polymerase sigma factor [candidate division WOR-3 bacterium]